MLQERGRQLLFPVPLLLPFLFFAVMIEEKSLNLPIDTARHMPLVLACKLRLSVNESAREHSRALLALRSLSSSTVTSSVRLLEYRPG